MERKQSRLMRITFVTYRCTESIDDHIRATPRDIRRQWSGFCRGPGPRYRAGRGSLSSLHDVISPFLCSVVALSFLSPSSSIFLFYNILTIPCRLQVSLVFSSQSSHPINFDRSHISFPMRTICGFRYDISTVFTHQLKLFLSFSTSPPYNFFICSFVLCSLVIFDQCVL